MNSFQNYYKEIIDKYQLGFKLVLGGTGLGKTSGIVELIKGIINNPQKSDKKKLIYIANRIQLLNEFKEELPEDIVCHQQSDLDTVLSKKISKDDIEAFLDEAVVQKYIVYFRKNNKEFRVGQVVEQYEFIKSFSEQVTSKSPEQLKEILRKNTSTFLSFFKRLLKTAYKVKTEQIHNKGFYISDYKELIDTKLIKNLFPYSNFKYNDEKQVLLVTLQKAFHGFFDGKKTVNFFNLDNTDSKEIEEEQNGRNIIFFDEFDFLESDLIDLVCQDVEIQQPFKFVAEFYNAMFFDKLPSENFLVDHPKIKKEILKIIGNIQSLKKYNIDFPRITHFVSLHDFEINQRIKELSNELEAIKRKRGVKVERNRLKEEIKQLNKNRITQKSIFQTRFSLTSTRLYLDDKRANSFNLTPNEDENRPSTLILLNIVNQSAAQIIRLFKKLENEEPDLYNNMIRYCYGKSDYRNDIKRIRQYPHHRRKTNTIYDKIQYNGFGLYEIQDFSETNDPEEVSLKYYMLFTTPEKIMLHLTKHNLVFGLSATSNINRLVKNFDTNWLASQIGKDYYELTPDNIQLIKKANSDKQKKRNNKVLFHKAELLGESSYEKKVAEHITEIARTNSDSFGKDPKYRIRRVNYFFSTLLWIIQSCGHQPQQLKTDTHLLFFYTFKQIKYFFDDTQENQHGLYTIDKGNKEGIFPYNYITIQGQKFIVVFYDAEKAKSVTNEPRTKKGYYNIFWQELPVIFVTQYASAGNGVNLQYYQSEKGFEQEDKEERKDFKNIHLLDEPRFYFSNINKLDKEQDKNAAIKKNIYYLAKLLFAKQQVDKEKSLNNIFRGYLNNIRESGRFNADYLKSTDGLFNQIAVFIQALGRIERVWSKMDDQTIILSTDIYARFKDFIFECSPVKNRISEYASDNLVALFEHVKEYYLEEDDTLEELTEEQLPILNNKCREKVRELLYDLNLLRDDKLITEEQKSVRKIWNNLRIDALKHDFNTPLMKKYNCVFNTNYVVINEYEKGVTEKTLYINKHNKHIAPFRGADYEEWNLNFPYRSIIKNSVIATYFELNQFEVGFNHHGQFFVPYFYQAILMGAIGEEAIKAIFKNPQTLNVNYEKGNWDIPKFISLKRNGKTIPLNDSEIPNSLFELADTKVEGKPWYIDCKNYSLKTLANFPVKENGKPLHPKLNEEYFEESTIRKFNRIQQEYSYENAKLIYINFIGGEDGKVAYFDIIDEQLIPTNLGFQDAKIIVIQGVLKRDAPNELTNAFINFFNTLNNAYYE